MQISITLSSRLLPLLFILMSLSLEAQPLWEPANTGAWGGSVRSFGFTPDGTVLAVISGEGLYRLEEDEAWRLVLPIENIGSIHTAPNGTLYVETLAGDIPVVWVSKDEGREWEFLIGSTWFFDVDSVGRIFRTGPPLSTLYRSDDGGGEWEAIEPEFDVGTFRINWDGDLFAYDNDEEIVWFSTDGGVDWNSYPFSLPAPRSYSGIPLHPLPGGEIAFHANQGLYVTADTGQTWTRIDTVRSDEVTVGTSGDLFSIVRNGGDNVYNGAFKGVRRYNKIEGWRPVTQRIVHEVAEGYDHVVWTAGVDGPYKGASRPVRKGMTNRTVVALTTDTAGVVYALLRNDILFFGSYPLSALYRSFDEGFTWEFVDEGYAGDLLWNNRTGSIIASDVEQRLFPDDIWTWQAGKWAGKEEGVGVLPGNYHTIDIDINDAGSYVIGTDYLPNGLGTWVGQVSIYDRTNDRSIHLDQGPGISSVAIDNDGRVYYALQDRSDAGISNVELRRLSSDYTTTDLLHDTINFQSLDAAPNNYLFGSGTILDQKGDVIEEGIFRLLPGGEEVELVQKGVTAGRFSFSPAGTIFAENEGNSLVSTDNGDSWQQLPFTLPAHGTTTPFTFHPNGTIIVRGAWELMISYDDGTTWENIDSNFTSSCYTVTKSGRIITGTKGKGLFRTVEGILSVEEEDHVATTIPAIHISPNPVTDQVSVRITMNQGAQLTARIYDVLGRERSTIIENEHISGEWDQTIELEHLDPGFYTLVFRVGDQEVTKQIIMQ